MAAEDFDIYVFDLDGTLLNTLEDLYLATNAAMRHVGAAERTKDEVRAFVGNGIKLLITRALGARAADEAVFNRAFSYFKEYYGANCAVKTSLYDGVEEVLLALKKAGKKCAVVSNKADFAVKLLAKQYFGELISVAIGENEAAGVKKKPAPDSVEIALRELQAIKEGAVYIGDSEVDIQTAKNAGLPCISVCWGMKSKEFLLENGAATILETPTELLEYI